MGIYILCVSVCVCVRERYRENEWREDGMIQEFLMRLEMSKDGETASRATKP